MQHLVLVTVWMSVWYKCVYVTLGTCHSVWITVWYK